MKDSVQLIVDLLRPHLKGTFKEFYDGDPDLIPEFNLPAIVVTKTADHTEAGTIAEDDVTETLVIKVIYNKEDDWANNVDPTNLTEKKIRNIIEQRDDATHRWLPSTIKAAVRKGLDGDRRIGESMDVEIGINPRPNDLITAEGHVTIQIKYSVDVD